jgi:hypothetical protein
VGSAGLGQSARLSYKRLELSWLAFQCSMCVGSGDSCLEYTVFFCLEKSNNINKRRHWDFLLQEVVNGEVEERHRDWTRQYLMPGPLIIPSVLM